MSRFRWPLVVLVICLPVALLATGVPLPLVDRPAGGPRPLPVPDGDQEMAWLHTTTAGTTWERFVSGVERARMLVPGLEVDDSAAFAEHSTQVPELVVGMPGRPGKLRIRWYKLTGEATADGWVNALADRDRPPLALIGGGSTDRAADLAKALAGREKWPGDRPLLLITTATADKVPAEVDDPGAAGELLQGKELIDVYDDRSFRFCFTNRQMAEAVLDFVWDDPELRPRGFAAVAPLAALSGLAAPAVRPTRAEKPHVFSVFWQDDPYSADLHDQFHRALERKLKAPAGDEPCAHFDTWPVPFSVGGFNRPNPYEAETAASILKEYGALPPQRSLLVLPTVTQPARRLLRTLTEYAPRARHRLVAVTGDGIPVNALYRDGEFAWPVRELPVPLVLFTHNNPVGWDAPDQPAAPPPGYGLYPPNSTEDVLHFAELTRVVAEACYAGGGGPVSRADELRDRLHRRDPALFDANGNRLGGTGEYVVVLWPRVEGGPDALPRARMAVWRRGPDRRWLPVREIEVDQQGSRPGPPAPDGGRRG